MTILMDGISSVYSIDAQINKLRALEGSNLPEADTMRLALAQNFNRMLDDLVSASNDKDDKSNSSGLDPFSFMSASNQVYMNNLMGQDDASLSPLAALEGNPLALQKYLEAGNNLSF